MKKICLLVILLLGFTATSSGYVLLHPGAIFYGTYQEITFSDTVKVVVHDMLPFIKRRHTYD